MIDTLLVIFILYISPTIVGLFFIWLTYKITHQWKPIMIEDIINLTKFLSTEWFVWLPILNIMIPFRMIGIILLYYTKDIKV